jgi:hypothetical protein
VCSSDLGSYSWELVSLTGETADYGGPVPTHNCVPRNRSMLIRPKSTASYDTYIRGDVPTWNEGGNGQVIVGGYNAINKPMRGLLKFPLTNIPVGAKISSAVLSLYGAAEAVRVDATISVHRALTRWYPGIKTDAVPDAGQDAASWSYSNANGAVAWAGGAGGGSGTDYAAVATGSFVFTAVAKDYTIDVTADVAAWMAGTPNYGWFLISALENTANTRKQFTSSEGTAANRPRLYVTYL